MLFRFPAGFVKHPEMAPGSIDEVRVLDGAAELEDMPASKEVARGCSLVVRGWGFDPLANAPARPVLTMDDRFAAEAVCGSPREDIAEHFQRAELTSTGFKGIMSTGGAALAPHSIRLYILSQDGTTYFETSSTYTFDVVQAAKQIPNLPAAEPLSIHVGIDGIATMEDPTEMDGSSPKVARGTILVVRGWAFDLKRKQPCERVFVSLGDECVRAIYGIPREDVVRDQNVPAARFSGFTARLSTASLPSGRHALRLVAVAADGKSLSEATHSAALEVSEALAER
jgi:hypothetical protein